MICKHILLTKFLNVPNLILSYTIKRIQIILTQIILSTIKGLFPKFNFGIQLSEYTYGL